LTVLTGPGSAVLATASLRVIDWPKWRLIRGRLAAAGCVLAYAAALMASGDLAWRWTGAVLVVEVLLLCLPWRMPREARSRTSFWMETLVGLSAPIGAVAIAAVTGSSWLSRGADWWWFLIAGAAGAGLIAVAGVDLKAVVSGDLGFVLGPTRHGYARAVGGALAPLGEEALFRGVVLAAAPVAVVPTGLLSAVAFVAIHHVQPGDNGRGSSRALAAVMLGAVVLLLLTLASGSIYPAVLAHALNNVPGVVLQLQRADRERNSDE
jgi:membrane protease YdiL (CAAX protease family)